MTSIRMGCAPGEIAVSPDEILIGRERRATRQAAALVDFGKPVLSVTVVMPGPTKDGWLPRRVMDLALDEIDSLIKTQHWTLLSREVFWRNTGPEAIYVLDVEAQLLKSAAIRLEDQHSIGRLWDLDVITASGALLSRSQTWRPARRCLLCHRPARECGRSRRHSFAELLATIENTVDQLDLHRGRA